MLYWPINSRSTLREGLYDYDAIGRLQETSVRKASAAGSSDAEMQAVLDSKSARRTLEAT